MWRGCKFGHTRLCKQGWEGNRKKAKVEDEVTAWIERIVLGYLSNCTLFLKRASKSDLTLCLPNVNFDEKARSFYNSMK